MLAARLFFLFQPMIIGSVSKDDGYSYGYGNYTKQEYYWLKKENTRAARGTRISVHFSAVLHKKKQKKNVKSPTFRFRRQREHITRKQ